MNQTLPQLYLKQLNEEAITTRQCLERITDSVLDFKPTESAMPLKSLGITLSEIPQWIAFIINGDDINFQTYERYNLESAANLATHFDECMAQAREALEKVSEEDMQKDFSLKMGEQILSTDTKDHSIDSTIRHLVHHRGQLTVYMRMNNIPIPKIYGPSGDDQTW